MDHKDLDRIIFRSLKNMSTYMKAAIDVGGLHDSFLGETGHEKNAIIKNIINMSKNGIVLKYEKETP